MAVDIIVAEVKLGNDLGCLVGERHVERQRGRRGRGKRGGITANGFWKLLKSVEDGVVEVRAERRSELTGGGLKAEEKQLGVVEEQLCELACEVSGPPIKEDAESGCASASLAGESGLAIMLSCSPPTKK